MGLFTRGGSILLAFRPINPYLWVMKTTIELPDEIFRKAKVAAAERHTTLKDLMTEALDRFLSSSEVDSAKNRKATLTRLLGEMKASNTEPMRPLSREQTHDR